MRRYRIRHHSHFRYSSPVVTSVHHLHLQPRQYPGQDNEFYQLVISPNDPSPVLSSDSWGNPQVVTQQAQTFDQLAFTSLAQIAVSRQAPQPGSSSITWEQAVDEAAANHDPAVQEFRWNSSYCRRDPMFHDLSVECFTPGRPTLEAVEAFTRHLFASFIYDPVATEIATPLSQVLAQGRGVCQDFAHLAIASLRSLGLPARYVSGYVETVPSAGQQRLQGADASHAWFSLWLPDLGWVDCDPTNGCLVADCHVAICHGRDFADISPVTGVILGGGHQGQGVEVDVIPEREWLVHSPWWPQPTAIPQ